MTDHNSYGYSGGKGGKNTEFPSGKMLSKSCSLHQEGT